MKKILTFVSPILAYFVLFGTSFAQTTSVNDCKISNFHTLKDLIMGFAIGCIFTRLISVIVGIGVIVFRWGIFKFISSEGEDKQGGRELMFWGIVGIFVMISLWGLVAILQNTFKF